MKIIKDVLRWLPALIVMIVIFCFSSIPSRDMPYYGFWDSVVKKGGHMLGYGFLALATWYGLKFEKQTGWLAFLFVILYAISDEFHQSFVPGRHATWMDVLVFDGSGAALMLLAASCIKKRMRRQAHPSGK
jgi:VanZ family protein